jgi:hypothetical protein
VSPRHSRVARWVPCSVLAIGAATPSPVASRRRQRRPERPMRDDHVGSALGASRDRAGLVGFNRWAAVQSGLQARAAEALGQKTAHKPEMFFLFQNSENE